MMNNNQYPIQYSAIDLDGFAIRDERARSEQYATDQMHITATHCPRCGCKLRQGKCWYGCDNPDALAAQAEVNTAILSVYDKPQEFDAEPACGNYTAIEVADMRHPTW